MSRMIIASIALVGILGGAFLVSQNKQSSVNNLDSVFFSSPGKANVPIQIQIKHTEIPSDSSSTTTLKAFFKAPGSEGDIQYQWDLPEGVTVTDGESKGIRNPGQQSIQESQISVVGLSRESQQRVRFKVQAMVGNQPLVRSASIVTQPENTWENYGPEIKKASDQLRQEADLKSED